MLPVGLLLVAARADQPDRPRRRGAFLAVLGFVMNRLNVSVTGMEGAAGVQYVPSWMEVTVSLGLVALGFARLRAGRALPPHLPGAPARPGERRG